MMVAIDTAARMRGMKIAGRLRSFTDVLFTQFSFRRIDLILRKLHIFKPSGWILFLHLTLIIFAGSSVVSFAYTLLSDSIEPPGADAVLGQPSFTAVASGDGDTQMNGPYDVAADESGVLYVADEGNDRILVFVDGDTTADTIIGGLPDGAGETALNDPRGLAVWQGGDTTVLFVSDAQNNRVLGYLVRRGGAATVLADTTADYVFGHASFQETVANGGDGAASPSETGLSAPMGLFVEESGSQIELYVADAENARVLRFEIPLTRLGSPHGAFDTHADAVWGQPGMYTNNPAASATGLSDIVADVFRHGGRLFVADFDNNRIVVESTGDTTWDGVYGQPNLTSSAAGVSATAVSDPFSVAVSPDGATLAIGDAGGNRVLLHADSSGADTVADDVVGDTDFTAAAFASADLRGIATPIGLFFQGADRLWIADNTLHRVLAFDGLALPAAAAGIALQAITQATSSAAETVPVTAAATDSFVEVILTGGGTTASPAAAADSYGTGADYTVVVVDTGASGLAEDTVVYRIHVWTTLETAVLFVGLRSDTTALEMNGLPYGITADDTGRRLMRATGICLEFGDSRGNLIGSTSTTSDLSRYYAYTIVYDLSYWPTTWFKRIGFDTSTGSADFRFWMADSWTGPWRLTDRTTRVLSGGGEMRIAVVGLTTDLPGALGGNSPSVSGVEGGGICLLEAWTPRPLAAWLAPLRRLRDLLLEGAGGRLFSTVYYLFS